MNTIKNVSERQNTHISLLGCIFTFSHKNQTHENEEKIMSVYCVLFSTNIPVFSYFFQKLKDTLSRRSCFVLFSDSSA